MRSCVSHMATRAMRSSFSCMVSFHFTACTLGLCSDSLLQLKLHTICTPCMPSSALSEVHAAYTGFAQETNASDMLMVKCPLPPVEQWDEVIRARLLYLLDQGLSSQLFLPASSLPAGAGSQVAHICLTAWQEVLCKWPDITWLGVMLASCRLMNVARYQPMRVPG